MASNISNSSRLALGRYAEIGQLYDARTECILNTSIYHDKSWPDIFVNKFPENKFTVNFALDTPAFNVLEFFNMKSEQQASVVAGLQVAAGAGALFKLKSTSNSFSAYLMYSVRTQLQHLNLSDPTLRDKLYKNQSIILSNNATHIVWGIEYGADVLTLYNCNWSPKDFDKQALALTNFIDGFKEAHKNNDVNKYLKNDFSVIEGLTATMYSDVNIVQNPLNVTFKDSLSYSRRVADVVAEDGRGRPVTLLLLPIQDLLKIEGGLKFYPVCNVALYKLLAFEKHVGLYENFYDLARKHGSLVMSDCDLIHITSIRNCLHLDLEEKRQYFKKWLIELRGKSPNLRFFFSGYTIDKIKDLLTKFSRVEEELKWHREFSLKGFIYLRHEDKLRQIIRANSEVYVLKFTSNMPLQNKCEFETKFNYFLSLWHDVKCRMEIANAKIEVSDPSSSSVDFVVFENFETRSNDVPCVIERYKNGAFIGFCKQYHCNIKDETTNLCTTVPFDTIDILSSSSESDNVAQSSYRWNIEFDKECKPPKPTSSAVVKIVCPGVLLGKCKANVMRTWTCENCTKVLEYDFDERFFCDCGVGPVTSCSFKCESKAHQGEYFTFNKMDGLNRLKKLKPREELNILVLGETGVGKSTFINAMSNYLTYETMAEAETSDLISLIPSSFTVTDKNYEEKTVQVGHDPNEAEEVGSSKTRSCRCYSFPSINRIVRIVDTPGIGDTKGIKQDAKNFDNILQFISHYSSIHGILMLLKPNNSRLSVFFRFCIQELLCHLHKDASENIVFVFTNARSTFYRPGDTLPPLKKLLKEVKDKEPYVEIPLIHERIYCVDNEAYRFLLALKSGVEFDEDYRDVFSNSWEKSVTECERLLNHVAKLKPHLIRDTLSVNEARRLIVALSKPLGDITHNIQLNIVMVQEQKAKIQLAGDDIAQLQKTLYVPVVDLEPVPFLYPRTVCAAPKCYKLHTIDGIQKIDYKQVCHKRCYLDNVAPETVNNPALRRCVAMGKNKICILCGCNYEKHMHVYYENKQIYTQKLDATVIIEIKNKRKRQRNVQKVINDLERRSTKLEEEQLVIMKTSAKFASFLKRSAITPYNDALHDYLEYLISVEEQKSLQSAETKALVGELTIMKRDYEAEVKVLEASFAVSDGTNEEINSVTINDINDSVKQLYSLEINGDSIKNMVQVLERARDSEHANYCEQVYQPTCFKNSTSNQGSHGKDSNALQKFWM